MIKYYIQSLQSERKIQNSKMLGELKKQSKMIIQVNEKYLGCLCGFNYYSLGGKMLENID